MLLSSAIVGVHAGTELDTKRFLGGTSGGLHAGQAGTLVEPHVTTGAGPSLTHAVEEDEVRPVFWRKGAVNLALKNKEGTQLSQGP